MCCEGPATVVLIRGSRPSFFLSFYTRPNFTGAARYRKDISNQSGSLDGSWFVRDQTLRYTPASSPNPLSQALRLSPLFKILLPPSPPSHHLTTYLPLPPLPSPSSSSACPSHSLAPTRPGTAHSAAELILSRHLGTPARSTRKSQLGVHRSGKAHGAR